MTISFLSSLIRLRVMPLTIVFLTMMFCVKAYDLAVGTGELSRMMLAGEAYAVTPDAAAPAPEASEPKKQGEPQKQAEAPSSAPAAKPAEQTPPAAEKAPAQATPVGEKAAEEGGAKLDKEYLDSPDAKQRFSQIELNILQSLAARREQLDKWEEEVHTKENLLGATEVRLNKRIEEIKTLEQNVRGLLAQYEKQEEANIRSLVKIYENMKPKEAARIFDELEMPVLLMVADSMSERKAAPILAKMNPMKAKELTVELSEQRKMLGDAKQALDGGAAQ